jgi:hypothetical protein
MSRNHPERRRTGVLLPAAAVMGLPPEPVLECSGLKRNGQKCTCTMITPESRVSGDPFCWVHDPRVSEEQKQAAVVRGAATTARRLRDPSVPNPALRTLDQIQAYNEETAGKFDRGEITARDVGGRTRIADTAIKAHDSNIGQRLDELEKLAASRARSMRVVR